MKTILHPIPNNICEAECNEKGFSYIETTIRIALEVLDECEKEKKQEGLCARYHFRKNSKQLYDHLLHTQCFILPHLKNMPDKSMQQNEFSLMLQPLHKTITLVNKLLEEE